MNELQATLDQAQALGKLLAEHPRVLALRQAQDAVLGSDAARALLDQYATHTEKLQRLEAARKPIEVQDKHRLAELERSMASNDALKHLMRARADYLELMTRVNEAMEGPILEAVGARKEPA